MPGHACYHCKQWVAEGEAHDCWTTTESALTRELPEDLRDAYERLRETASEFGEQRIYASHNSIMFSRKSCYFFVRPRKTSLEVCVFLGRPIKARQVRRAERSSKIKVANFIHLTHRDEVEAPITDWLREAYDFASPELKLRPTQKKAWTASKNVSASKKARPASKHVSASKKAQPASKKVSAPKKVRLASKQVPASKKARPRR